MNLISDVHEDGIEASFVFVTDDIARANLLRRALMMEISTAAVDIVTFHQNMSPCPHDILALRLGQCVIDRSKVNRENPPIVTVRITGPKEVSTRDIPDIPFVHDVPLTILRENEVLHMELRVVFGTGATHVKWRPVNVVVIKEVENGYRFTLERTECMSLSDILREGLTTMILAAERPAKNIFLQPLVPKEPILPENV